MAEVSRQYPYGNRRGNIPDRQVHPGRALRYYDLIGMGFVAVVLISTIAAQKLIALGPLVMPGGIVLFPVSYIFSDILSECYGFSHSRRIVWMGFAANFVMALVFTLVVALPPAPAWPYQTQFATVLGFVPRIVVASLLAYLAGEFANSYVLVRMKVFTQGRHLWMRTIGSTLVGEGIDSLIFMLIAFVGTMPWPVMWTATASVYLVKVAYEIVITPLTYVIVRQLKQAEGVDHYDHDTDFNPFRFK
ncbi:queuosine precursor transporter [Methylomagnum ishizawai]|uniref:queuosine precursor transporter n=1 Tax=Methylomagnum ishizawai TaxID=1760988 RepID=UPI001C3250B7|nr:queuosine precursor transporter [Methylomagnum ishizawai]BBL73562.1 transporter [Methylomagnum ishizawai]